MAKTRDGGLTPKQKLFIYEYMIDFNQTQAALRAGFSPGGARAHVSKLMQNPEVKAVIDSMLAKVHGKAEERSEKILKRLDWIGGVDIAEIYDDFGVLLPVKAMPVEVRKAIASIETYEETVDGVKVGETKKVKFWDKVKSNELLGKADGLFKDEHTTIINNYINMSDSDINSRIEELLEKRGV